MSKGSGRVVVSLSMVVVSLSKGARVVATGASSVLVTVLVTNRAEEVPMLVIILEVVGTIVVLVIVVDVVAGVVVDVVATVVVVDVNVVVGTVVVVLVIVGLSVIGLRALKDCLLLEMTNLDNGTRLLINFADTKALLIARGLYLDEALEDKNSLRVVMGRVVVVLVEVVEVDVVLVLVGALVVGGALLTVVVVLDVNGLVVVNSSSGIKGVVLKSSAVLSLARSTKLAKVTPLLSC